MTNSLLRAATIPEVVFAPLHDNTASQRLLRLAKQGKLRPLYRGIYTSNFHSEPASIVQRNWSNIVSYLLPGAVLSYRSGFDTTPRNEVVYVSRETGRRKFELPGLTIHCALGKEHQPILTASRPGAQDVPYLQFYVPSPARAFLENLVVDKRLSERQLQRNELEERLEKLLVLRGAKALNGLRDDAREVADKLNLHSEFNVLNKIVGALLNTHPAHVLSSELAKARAHGMPYDPQRIALFERMVSQLNNQVFAEIEEPTCNSKSRELFAFIESYFSNYIEGTTFTVAEAQSIIFDGKLISNRTQDSHDVKGTFDAALLEPFRSTPPKTGEDLLTWLRQAHALVMRSRPDKHPGEWKTEANQAGNTLFVLPELVPETLRRAWSMLPLLKQPMQRALFAMMVVGEIHPFTDGNGRTSRLLMNALLSEHNECRIVIPTLFREDYLLSIKAISHQGDATAYIRAMRIAQLWTSQLQYDTTVADMDLQLQRCNAKQEDNQAYHLLSPMTMERIGVNDLENRTWETSTPGM